MSDQDKAREIAHRIYDDWRNLQIDPDTNETMTAYGMVMKIAGEVSESQRKELEKAHEEWDLTIGLLNATKEDFDASQQEIKELRELCGELLNSLEVANKELSEFGDDAVCDHSVGICWCGWWRSIELIRKSIAKAKERLK